MITQSLKSVSYFHGLTDAEYERLSHIAIHKSFAPGELLIEQNNSDKMVYIITKGVVKVYRAQADGTRIPFGIVGQGEMIGEMSIVDGEPRSATVEAVQQTEVLMFQYQQFLAFISEHPDIFTSILKTIVARLRDAHQKMEDVASLSLVDRTWNALKILAPHFQSKEIPLSHEDLADIIGATRARVSEALESLRKHKKIKLSYRSIQIL